MQVIAGTTRAAETSAQYPHPARARTTATMTEPARPRISITETTENRMARLSKAIWITESPVIKIVNASNWVTPATRGSLYNLASRDPVPANAIVKTKLAATLIQNMLLARA